MEIPQGTVIIAGPTGVGKTVLALSLAEELGGEIVGADAFQLYADLPILTAQPTASDQARVPHHLVGVIDPREVFDAGRYQRIAKPILHEIAARGRVPIVVGGSGLYVKALLGGLNDLPKDLLLREEFARLSLPELVARLEEADPAALPQLDLANRRRVERALEIVLLTGKPLAYSLTTKKHPLPPGVRALLVTREREELNARITANVATMFAQGVEAEVAALPEEAIGPTAAMTLGLKQIQSLLRGKISREEAITAITTATQRYAKRQMTWFLHQHEFPILNLSLVPNLDRAKTEALHTLQEKRRISG